MGQDQGSTTPLRVGIAGYGLAGEVFHAPLIAATDGLEVAALVTTDEGGSPRPAPPSRRPRRAVRGRPVGAHRRVRGGHAPPLHAEQALAAIARDIPVVVDKPFASTAEEAERRPPAAA